MKKLNVIIVYNKKEEKILMCKREKEPYKGMFNLVGGKVENGEEELHAAYRELEEETGITKSDIKLTNIMNLDYELKDMELEVYAGKLNKDVELVEEVNKLYWIDKDENFFDMDKFAGEGNIGHMLKQVEMNKENIFQNENELSKSQGGIGILTKGEVTRIDLTRNAFIMALTKYINGETWV